MMHGCGLCCSIRPPGCVAHGWLAGIYFLRIQTKKTKAYHQGNQIRVRVSRFSFLPPTYYYPFFLPSTIIETPTDIERPHV